MLSCIIILIVPNEIGAQWSPVEETSNKEYCLVFLIDILVSKSSMFLLSKFCDKNFRGADSNFSVKNITVFYFPYSLWELSQNIEY